MSGATSFTSVPIIDISGLRSPELAERERVASEIGKAAAEVGFFYVSGAGVDDALFETMLAATKEFFVLPLEEKMRYYIGLSKCHRGYVPSGEEGLATGMPERAWLVASPATASASPPVRASQPYSAATCTTPTGEPSGASRVEIGWEGRSIRVTPGGRGRRGLPTPRVRSTGSRIPAPSDGRRTSRRRYGGRVSSSGAIRPAGHVHPACSRAG